MTAPRALRHPLRAASLVAAAALAGCGTTATGPDPVQRAAEVDLAVAARLAALFPEVPGAVTRDSILTAVAADSARAARGDGQGAARARAVAALLAGDDETARRVLSELAADREAVVARALSAAGDVEGALAAYGAALDVAPGSALLRRERGELLLRDGLARGDRERVVAADADFAEALRRLPADEPSAARAWLGASRAARALDDAPRARDAARRAFEVGRRAADLAGPDELAERTRAEALLLARAAGGTGDAAWIEETRSALEALVARAPDEPWGWTRLAELLAETGSAATGRKAARTGLAVFPRDEALADALARTTRALEGRAAVIATFEDLARRDPSAPGALWRPAEERFAEGLERLAAGDARGAEESLAEAGRGFLQAGAATPDRRTEANLAVARALAGVGHARLAQGEHAAARDAFLEADARDRRAVVEPLVEGLPSALDALRGSARVLRERGADPSRPDAAAALEEAAATMIAVRRIAPGDAEEAELATTLAHDAALACEARARRDAAKGRADDARRGMERAQVLMEAAYESAVDAARARPTEAAAVRTPGRILARFLRRDVTQAEQWLTAAVKLSEAEVARARDAAAEPGLGAEERERRARRLEEAESRLGDAYQDLGVLHLELKGDPHGAKTWFERALATGPDPRADLRAPDGYLTRCEAAIANGGDPRAAPHERWGVLP